MLSAQHLEITFNPGTPIETRALRGMSLDIPDGQFVTVIGSNGAGKSTFLNAVSGDLSVDKGRIEIAGQALDALDDDALSDFRARHIGFVFQHFNLLPVLSAYENVEYPLILAGVDRAARRQRVRDMLAAVGLADRMHNRPGQLSGGQQQRVAIARALVGQPALVLADEPTANLDSHTGAEIIALMRRLQREHAVSFVFSSHDAQIIAAADALIPLRDGRLQPATEGQP